MKMLKNLLFDKLRVLRLLISKQCYLVVAEAEFIGNQGTFFNLNRDGILMILKRKKIGKTVTNFSFVCGACSGSM